MSFMYSCVHFTQSLNIKMHSVLARHYNFSSKYPFRRSTTLEYQCCMFSVKFDALNPSHSHKNIFLLLKLNKLEKNPMNWTLVNK